MLNIIRKLVYKWRVWRLDGWYEYEMQELRKRYIKFPSSGFAFLKRELEQKYKQQLTQLKERYHA